MHFQKKFLLIVLLNINMQGCQTVSTTPTHNYEQSSEIKAQIAAEYIRNGQLSAAKATLNEATLQDPKNALVCMMLAIVYQIDGGAENLKNADIYYKKAINLNPNEPQIRNNYGQYLFLIGRYSEAIEQFLKASNTIEYDRRAYALNNLGQAYLKTNKLQDANEAFVRSLKIEKTSDGLIGLAETSLLQGAFIEAEELYKEYMENINISDTKPKELLIGVKIFKANGNINTMKKLGQALVSNFPKSPEAIIYKGL